MPSRCASGWVAEAKSATAFAAEGHEGDAVETFADRATTASSLRNSSRLRAHVERAAFVEDHAHVGEGGVEAGHQSGHELPGVGLGGADLEQSALEVPHLLDGLAPCSSRVRRPRACSGGAALRSRTAPRRRPRLRKSLTPSDSSSASDVRGHRRLAHVQVARRAEKFSVLATSWKARSWLKFIMPGQTIAREFEPAGL